MSTFFKPGARFRRMNHVFRLFARAPFFLTEPGATRAAVPAQQF
jgi:hypothetical protein